MSSSKLEPRARRVRLPGRDGEMALLDYGPPERPVDVVFCHANGFNAQTYRSILSPLAGEMRIIAPDMRGHGATTLPADVETWPVWYGYRDDLLALLAAQVDHPVVLAGHSIGAVTSLLAAAEAPERVREVVMFEAVLLPPAKTENWDHPMVQGALRRQRRFPSREAAENGYRGRGAFATWRDEQLADYVQGGLRATDDGFELACAPDWEAKAYAVYDLDIAAELGRLRRPVRAFVGDRSFAALVPPALSGHPLARVESIAGGSHFLPMERPDLVQAALREAVKA